MLSKGTASPWSRWRLNSVMCAPCYSVLSSQRHVMRFKRCTDVYKNTCNRTFFKFSFQRAVLHVAQCHRYLYSPYILYKVFHLLAFV